MRYFDVAISPALCDRPTEHRFILANDAVEARRRVREGVSADWQVWPALG